MFDTGFNDCDIFIKKIGSTISLRSNDIKVLKQELKVKSSRNNSRKLFRNLKLKDILQPELYSLSNKFSIV